MAGKAAEGGISSGVLLTLNHFQETILNKPRIKVKNQAKRTAAIAK
jgi:hypothetical protein